MSTASAMSVLVMGDDGKMIGSEGGTVRLVRTSTRPGIDTGTGVKVPDWMGGGRVNPQGNKVRARACGWHGFAWQGRLIM